MATIPWLWLLIGHKVTRILAFMSIFEPRLLHMAILYEILTTKAKFNIFFLILIIIAFFQTGYPLLEEHYALVHNLTGPNNVLGYSHDVKYIHEYLNMTSYKY